LLLLCVNILDCFNRNNGHREMRREEQRAKNVEQQ